MQQGTSKKYRDKCKTVALFRKKYTLHQVKFGLKCLKERLYLQMFKLKWRTFSTSNVKVSMSTYSRQKLVVFFFLNSLDQNLPAAVKADLHPVSSGFIAEKKATLLFIFLCNFEGSQASWCLNSSEFLAMKSSHNLEKEDEHTSF